MTKAGRAMTSDQKRALITGGFGLLVLAIIYMLFRGCSNPINMITKNFGGLDFSPDYVDGPVVNVDFPPNTINLGDIYLDAPEIVGNCACGCFDTGPFARAMETAVNQYTTNLVTLERNIADAYIAAIPSYVSPFFNNSVAAAQYGSSAPVLARGF